MTIEENKFYTLKEVAEILRVSRQTIYNNLKRGRIKATKYGKEYRISEEELQDLLKNGYGAQRIDV